MPYSAPTFDSEVELYFKQVRHDSVLDIGAGEGKYGRILRRARPKIRLIGVEVDAGYVEQYKLRDIYDEVWVHDVAELMNDPGRTFRRRDSRRLYRAHAQERRPRPAQLSCLPIQNHYR
jgi:predicted TPR repeat methyltransferase